MKSIRSPASFRPSRSGGSCSPGGSHIGNRRRRSAGSIAAESRPAAGDGRTRCPPAPRASRPHRRRRCPRSDLPRHSPGVEPRPGRAHRLVAGGHAAQHVVRRAVENAGHARELVAGKAFADAVDQRNAAADRGLEPDLRAGRRGEAQQRRSLGRQQHLVRGHDRDAAFERAAHPVARRMNTAHHFDDDVGARGEQFVEILGPRHGLGDPVRSLSRDDVAVEDVRQLQSPAKLGALDKNARDRLADRAEAEQRDAQRTPQSPPPARRTGSTALHRSMTTLELPLTTILQPTPRLRSGQKNPPASWGRRVLCLSLGLLSSTAGSRPPGPSLCTRPHCHADNAHGRNRRGGRAAGEHCGQSIRSPRKIPNPKSQVPNPKTASRAHVRETHRYRLAQTLGFGTLDSCFRPPLISFQPPFTLGFGIWDLGFKKRT